MKIVPLVGLAALLAASPAFAQYKSKHIYDESQATGNTRTAPSIQGRSQGKLQTGSGEESGGYARERLRR